MSSWVACKRATLLVPSGPFADPERKHLHVVLNDPFDCGNGRQVLLVCACSIPSTNIYDPSCTLFPDEHPFITKHSYIAYRFAMLLDPGSVEAKVASGEFVAKSMMVERPFAHIVSGLFDSPQASPKYKNFLRSALGL